MMQIVVADIGGTHARFALAKIDAGCVITLSEPVMLQTGDHASLREAWGVFAARQGAPLPRAAAIAVAGPVGGETLALTNTHWVIHPAAIDAELGLDRHLLINDFEAVGHAVAAVGADHLRHLCGPQAVPDDGVTTIIGPGTGLGVAQLWRSAGERRVIATEGGHVDFAPRDADDDALLSMLRARHGRVSVERVVSGPGLAAIYASLAGEVVDERALWQRALSGADAGAVAALARFCASLGAVAGDLALAHGANAVVIAGGLGSRLETRLSATQFAAQFVSKGRFSERMKTICVRVLTHPQPGLLGAAAAFTDYCLPIQSATCSATSFAA